MNDRFCNVFLEKDGKGIAILPRVLLEDQYYPKMSSVIKL